MEETKDYLVTVMNNSLFSNKPFQQTRIMDVSQQYIAGYYAGVKESHPNKMVTLEKIK